MRAATPTTQPMDWEEYLAVGLQWDYMGGEDDESPFECKAANWGWLNGRRVAIDYSTSVRHKI
jgi:hypothetical protein